MGTESLNCPNCGAALHARSGEDAVVCAYCHSTIHITTQKITDSNRIASADDAALSPSVTERIQQLLREGQRIEAIKLYREQTQHSLKASKEAVDAVAESMGLGDSIARRSRWTCVGLVVGLLLWTALLVLTPAGVRWAVGLAFGEAVSGETLETLQVVCTLFLAFGPVAGLVVWASVGNRK